MFSRKEGGMEKRRVGLIFGGRSVEHEVSLASATSILKALDPNHYDVVLIAVAPDGSWHLGPPTLPPEDAVTGEPVALPAAPGDRTLVSPSNRDLGPAADLDVVFPIIHGCGGEDGTLQGLLELAGVPYVGSGVLGSALQMDKEVAKRLLAAAGVPVVPWVVVRSVEVAHWNESASERVVSELGLPLFVKPSNLGSSVGISRVSETAGLGAALREASRYDTKLLVERGIDAREIEVALLGNDPIEASVPGEIRTRHAFYDYEAKYADDTTDLIVPAPLSEEQTRRTQELAVVAMQTLEGSGLGRVDFLLDRETGELYVNEVNSLPGFTEASMYPRLWEASGVPYPALLDRLIELGLERHHARARLETIYRRT
jgi:D-alanine-D-alanine ligase